MPTPRLFVAFILTLITAATLCAQATRPAKAPVEDFAVVEIHDSDGVVSLAVMPSDDVRPMALRMDTEYQAADKKWSQQEDLFFRTPGNGGKSFDVPRPQRPSARSLRYRLSHAAADAALKEIKAQEMALKQHTFFASMLGTYKNKAGPTWYINLSVPNGTNVVSEDIMAQLRAHVEMPLTGFTATGRIHISSGGIYVIDVQGSLLIDGKSVGSSNRGMRVDFRAGTHKIEVQAHGKRGGIEPVHITIRSQADDAVIPIYNTQWDIEQFKANRIKDHIPIEVINWSPVSLGDMEP